MSRRAPEQDIDESALSTHEPKDAAAGVKAVMVSLRRSWEQMGAGRTIKTLPLLNQRSGFDCPGCAWPDPRGEDKHRSPAEFCENGAKAVAEEATTRKVDAEFFAAHSVAELADKTDYWLGQQGRLTQPMILRDGDTHYRPIDWDAALDVVADGLRELPSADQAAFYTSGRTSNEAAFLYQLMVRSFGTNNLPDCSNMCHESSGSALSETIGIGKGSVSLEDVENADLILVVGQNPGTNHPRMLSSLEKVKRNGGKIVAVNPLPEAGLMRFKNPQNARGVAGGGTALTDEFAQIRLGGDLALFKALTGLLLQAEEAAPGTVLDREFIEQHGHGFEEFAAQAREIDWDATLEATAMSREQIEKIAQLLISSERTIACWAMGLTQHKQAVPTIREVTNLLLMRGMIGKPGAGVCPVRGHSNVQGDRTMGIWEKMPEKFLAAMESEFGIPMPRRHGYDTVDTLQAMKSGKVQAFLAVGGNFVAATPDTAGTERALRGCDLTVQVSTKLNRSHVVPGRTALILPTLGRTERDEQESGAQFVTVEDSMSVVHASRGRLAPTSQNLLSEVAILCRLARKLLGDEHPAQWEEFERDYDSIRRHIANVVPGCDDYNARVREPDGFVLPHPPRDSRSFPTATGKANFTINTPEPLRVPEGRLLLQTLRSHDQYNTTIYGLSDRYRGIEDARRVVMLNEKDIAALGFSDGEAVDLVSEWPDADGNVEERRAERFRIVAYPTAQGCAAAYYPEANPLVPLGSVAEKSNTPVSKAIVVRLERLSEQ
ncbi:MAG: FdhF/YdeP family oxidoreductase [Saccharopolyspora sp.]|uniref:FdhF/YdeP family oxidoreductase n=1 Tax=Saccharopolyspora TaxID=1835 RepID=UPI00190B4629|nr:MULTISPECIES: FdhF/YdeP family oxidoreductase [unclassified Saccharopolyspora]MBK0868198.1 FdhF/YdeP family oxidoreductase [Saccharopolyspora sp. HNM0986]MBQ6641406.1 FdhF/YdeP family oxidoreductase [Saccharopolyspora sp.]